MLYFIAIGLLCFSLGLYASLLTPYHRTLVRRLKNIKEVAEDAYNGFVDTPDAISFIICEADLNINTMGWKVITILSFPKGTLRQFSMRFWPIRD